MNITIDAGISLGTSCCDVEDNIEAIKDVEVDRLMFFHDNNPDMFLPSNIDVTGEELAGASPSSKFDDVTVSDDHISEIPHVGSSSIEVFNRKGSNRKKHRFW